VIRRGARRVSFTFRKVCDFIVSPCSTFLTALISTNMFF